MFNYNKTYAAPPAVISSKPESAGSRQAAGVVSALSTGFFYSAGARAAPRRGRETRGGCPRGKEPLRGPLSAVLSRRSPAASCSAAPRQRGGGLKKEPRAFAPFSEQPTPDRNQPASVSFVRGGYAARPREANF